MDQKRITHTGRNFVWFGGHLAWYFRCRDIVCMELWKSSILTTIKRYFRIFLPIECLWSPNWYLGPLVVIILNNKKINECIEDLEKNLFAQQIFSIFPMSSVIQLRWVVSGTFLCNLHMILWTDHPSSLRRQLSHRHRLLGLGYKMLEINTQLSKKSSGHLITTTKKSSISLTLILTLTVTLTLTLTPTLSLIEGFVYFYLELGLNLALGHKIYYSAGGNRLISTVSSLSVDCLKHQMHRTRCHKDTITRSGIELPRTGWGSGCARAAFGSAQESWKRIKKSAKTELQEFVEMKSMKT